MKRPDVLYTGYSKAGSTCLQNYAQAHPQAWRKRFGFQLFADEDHTGLPIMIYPESATLQVGDTEAPFAVADLPEEEDLEFSI